MSLLVTQLRISQQLDPRDPNCIRAENFIDRRFPTRTPNTFPPPPPSTPRGSSTERLPDMVEPHQSFCVCTYDQVEMVLNKHLGSLPPVSPRSFFSEAEMHYPCLSYNDAFRLESEKLSSLKSTGQVCSVCSHSETVAGNTNTDNGDALSQAGSIFGRHSSDLLQSASQNSHPQTSVNSKIDQPIRDIRYGWIGRGTRRMIDGALCCLPQRKDRTA